MAPENGLASFFAINSSSANSSSFASQDSILFENKGKAIHSISHFKDDLHCNGNSQETPMRGIAFQEGPQDFGITLGDRNMASRDAEDAVVRRFQAASWLQKMIGPLDLPSEPTEEDLRLSLRDGTVLCDLVNKVNPGAVPKIVEASLQSSPFVDLLDSSNQHLENIKNFISALEDMRLPAFEVSDLEQGSLLPTSSARIVDCLLTLKSYCEWKQGRGSGLWRYGGTLNSPNNVRSSQRDVSNSPSNLKSVSSMLNSASKMTNQPRKRWVLPELDSLGDANVASTENSSGFLGHKLGMSQHANGVHKLNGSSEKTSVDENIVSNSIITGTALTSTQIHHISQKFREILHLKTRGVHDVAKSENSSVLNGLDNASSQSLSSLVSSIIGEKQPNEVTMLVEFMLKKVMEEFERRLVTQGEQVLKLKNSLKEHLTREDRLAARAKVLETLAAGTGEEVKLVSNQLQKIKIEKREAEHECKAKDEEMAKLSNEREEHQKVIEALKKELEMVKITNQEHMHELELQKRELELELQNELKDIKSMLEESQNKVHELEATSAFEMQTLRERDTRYQKCMLSQRQLFQDLKMVSQITRQDILSMQGCWQRELEALEMQLQGLANAAAGYYKVLAENRQLYNEVQDLKGNIRVYCRVRPFLPGQSTIQSSVDFIGENGEIMIVNPNKQGKEAHKTFGFNKVFGASASQEEVFLDTQPLIRSVLDGYNVCIFAYGQTGSGKTFTMSGPNSSSQKEWGVNYRALNDLFQISQSRKDVFKYEVGVQMIEIYNEQVRDLLAIEGPNRRLEIRNSSHLNGLNVPDASMLPVNSTVDVLELMKIGQKNRAVGATALNERSSRSHSVLTVHVLGTDMTSGSILRGCLHLVDLAGSERVDRSEATGDRLKEAQHINKSLSALGDVISALAQKSSHVPYRNSKLTQLLQDSLGGQAKTLMFVHISPDIESFGETISTLKFAERVASVELGAARSNKESKEVRELKEQICSLKDVVCKKDAEIDRLQAMKDHRNSTVTSMVGIEKPKTKAASTPQSQKLKGDTQHQQRNRRRGIDSGGSAEVQKQSAVPVFHDTLSQDSGAASPALSPKESKAVPGAGEEFAGKLRVVKVPRGNGSVQNKSFESHNAQTPLQANQKANHDFRIEQEALSKEWRDRIKSSTDSSLLGTASVEEILISWDSDHFCKNDGEQSVPISPHLRSGLEREYILQPGKYAGTHSIVQSGDCLNTKEVESSTKNTNLLNTSRNLRIETDRVDLREGDAEERASDFSDGELSQAETEVSFLSTTFNEKRLPNSDRTSRSERRKLPQSDIPRPPSRNDWRSMHNGQTYSRMRRHSAVVPATALDAERLAAKRLTVAGEKHAVEGGLSSFSSDSGLECSPSVVPSRQNINGQVISSKSKRWL